jgi:hypothetical protein
MTKKQSTLTRSRTARAATGNATARKGKRRTAALRIKVRASATPTPLIRITSVLPLNPIVPCALTVTATCRASLGQSPGAYLLDTTGSPPNDLAPVSGPGPDPNNPQWTFNLTTAGKAYAVEVFITDDATGDVLVCDSQTIST